MILVDSSSVTVNNDSDMNRIIDRIDEWLMNNCSIYVMLVSHHCSENFGGLEDLETNGHPNARIIRVQPNRLLNMKIIDSATQFYLGEQLNLWVPFCLTEFKNGS
ncbi:unnamed protein product [Meganyctiphanes norvegica]|uniref:Uncharacterized protein n=1 Tax=Meganyctiphanes norvegica TaxID=48144 RepID=A0AAV2PZL0_MEGNR